MRPETAVGRAVWLSRAKLATLSVTAALLLGTSALHAEGAWPPGSDSEVLFWTWNNSAGEWTAKYNTLGTDYYYNDWGYGYHANDYSGNPNLLPWPGLRSDVVIQSGSVNVGLFGIEYAGAGSVSIDSAATMTISGGLTLNTAGGRSGTLTNAGSLSLNGGINATAFVNTGSLTVTGNNTRLSSLNLGSATFAGAPVNLNVTDSPSNLVLSGSVTNSVGHVVRGGGIIHAAFTNHGTLTADNPAVYLGLQTNAKSNDGLMQAVSGATLSINVPIDNTNGTIAANGGTVFMYNSATITGGTLAGNAIYTSGLPRIDSVRIAAGAQVFLPSGSSLDVVGDLANDGTITVNAPAASASDSSLRFLADSDNVTTLSGSGTIVLNLDPDRWNSATLRAGDYGTNTLVNGPMHSIRGRGRIAMALSNLGTLEASSDGYIYLDRAPVQFSGNTLTGGTWIARANGSISVNSSANLTTNAATVILDGPGSTFANINELNDNQSSFTITGGRNFTTAGSLANSGTLHVGRGSTLTVNGAYQPTAGSATVIDGDLVSAAMAIRGTLGGSGSVSSNVTLAPGAVLAPGNSPGTLTINGDLDLGDGAVYSWEISSQGQDLVHVTGNLNSSESATLMVSLYGTDLPLSGDYVLFDVDGTIGQLPQWTTQLPEGVTAGDVVVNGHQVVLTNVAVPEPAATALLTIGAGAGLLRRRRVWC